MVYLNSNFKLLALTPIAKIPGFSNSVGGSNWIWVFHAILVVACLLLFSDYAYSQIPSPATVAEEQDYAFAHGLYKDGLYQLAAEQLDQFLRKYPSSARRTDATFLRIECQFFSEQFPQALAGYTRFVKDHPRSPLADDALFRMGEVNLKLKQYAAAVTSFKSVLDKYEESEFAGEAAYWAGEAYLKNEDYPNALKYYTLAYEHYPQSPLRDYAVYSIGWTNQRKGDFAAAIKGYEDLLTEFPASTLASPARVRIGECYFYAGEYRKAVDALTRMQSAIAEPDERGEAEYLIGESHYRLQDYPAAQRQYESFLKNFPGHKLEREVVYALGWALLKQNKNARAAEMFGRLAEGDDGLAHAALYRRSTVEALLARKSESLTTLVTLLEREPRGEFSDNALYDLGVASYEAGNYADAEREFRRVVGEFPEGDVLADAQRMAGEALVMQQKYQEALPFFDRALAHAQASFEVKLNAHFQGAWCLYKAGDHASAAPRFARFVETYPQHPKAAEARFWLAESEYQRGNYGAALKAYEAASETPAKKAEALYGAGWSYLKLQNYPPAVGTFERLIAEFPRHALAFDSRFRLADAYFSQKDYRRAAASYRTILRMYPDSATADYASYQLGQSLFRQGDQSEAYRQFASLITTHPSSNLADDAQYALGWINFQKKEYNEAIREFQSVVRTYPRSELVPRALYSMGDSYFNMKQYVAAEKAYREVLQQYPTSPLVADAITGIQYCLVAQGKQQQAVTVIEEFLKDHPGSTVAEDLQLKKGDLLFEQQKFSDAIKAYRAFVDQYPGSRNAAAALFAVAKSYEAQENLTEAAITYERAAGRAGAGTALSADALFKAADLFALQNQADKSGPLLDRVEKESTDPALKAEAVVRSGKLHRMRGSQSEAARRFERARDTYPNTPAADVARVALAGLRLEAGDFSTARSLAEQVAVTRTDDVGAEAQWTMGAAYAGMKDFAQAQTAFLRVRYVFPAYERWVAKAFLGLGGVYEAQNNAGKAREAYQSVLRYSHEQESVAEAEKRLKALERR